MAAYLRFYQFASSPFDGSVAKRGMVLGTQALRGALAQVKQALEEGAPRICLSGSDGLGKTSLGRALPKLLANEAQVAISIDPNKSWEEVRARACKRFGIEGGAMSRKSLAAAREPGKRLVIVFDQAERLSHEILDHLDILLQYKDDEGQQLVHCVMLANLDSAASGAEIPLLWWLDKYTTLQLQFSPIPVEGVKHYVEKHLSKAGWSGGELFTAGALRSIHAYTGGVPGAINELCQRILVEGGLRSITSINEDFIDRLCGDDLGPPSPAASRDSAVDDEPEAGESLDHTADFSMSDFAGGPTAQEMLDDPNALAALDDEPEVNLRPEPETAPVVREDLASLLVTADSTEHLQTASDKRERASEADASLELEDEPAANRFADLYEQNGGSPSQLVGVSRPGSGVGAIQRPRRRTGGWVMAALVIAGLGWFAYTQLGVSTGLIESAEVEFERVLEKAPKLDAVTARVKAKMPIGSKATDDPDDIDATDDESDAEDDLEEDVELADAPHRSLIDRADELVADPNAKLVPVPDVAITTTDGTGGDAAELTEDGDDGEALAKSKIASPPDAPEVATVQAEAKTATPAHPRAPKPATTDIPSEMLVINEYTALPEAASAAPKLVLPKESEDDEDGEVAQAEDELEPRTAATPKPTSPPARIDEAPGAPASASEPTPPALSEPGETSAAPASANADTATNATAPAPAAEAGPTAQSAPEANATPGA